MSKSSFLLPHQGRLPNKLKRGHPADLFISADNKWMDYLDGKGKVVQGSRFNLAGNSLVLIAPRGKGFVVQMEKGFDFADSFKGKLCTGQPESVPAGIYAKESSSKLGWWDEMKDRVVGTDDVRAALDLVGRGECVGIVYTTDALASSKVETVATFPDELHAPIVYPAALLTQSAEAKSFLDYLKGSARVFAKYGFKV